MVGAWGGGERARGRVEDRSCPRGGELSGMVSGVGAGSTCSECVLTLARRTDSKPSPAPSAGATPQDFTPTPSTADPKLQALREQEIGDVFGREDLPILERIDYEVRPLSFITLC